MGHMKQVYVRNPIPKKGWACGAGGLLPVHSTGSPDQPQPGPMFPPTAFRRVGLHKGVFMRGSAMLLFIRIRREIKYVTN